MFLDRSFHHVSDLVFIGNIAVHVAALVYANGCGYLVTQLVLDISNHDHAYAMLGKKACGGLAYAACTPGDYGYFALYFVVAHNGGVCHIANETIEMGKLMR
jgi:hypothetical protein